MSKKTLPIMFINLSGEMMYILDQRLKAQNVSKEKSVKVMSDIISTMFNEQFVEELFKPQELYSKQALRSLFEKLAHSSIMRLNAVSMDKLYDLMSMVFKYQVSLCPRAEDMLFITLNHLDGIRKYAEDSSDLTKLVDNVYMKLIQTYAQMSAAEYLCIRLILLTFFQDFNVRVSVLLKKGYQLPNGKFVLPKGGPVPYGVEMPGTIQYFGKDGQIIGEDKFESKVEYKESLPLGSLEKFGFRGTDLGKNIYADNENVQGDSKPDEQIENNPVSNSTENNGKQTPSCEGLLLLSSLIGRNAVPDQVSDFTVGIPDIETEIISENAEAVPDHNEVVNISIPQCTEQSSLHKIISDLTIEDKEEGSDDILGLLDLAT